MPYKDLEKQRASREQYRRDNREYLRKRYNEWRSKRRAEVQIEVNKCKDVPCADCDQSFPPYVMDFDHVRGEKLFAIAVRPPGISLAKVLEEISKCDIVCANCHRIRTHLRKAYIAPRNHPGG